MNTPRQIKRRAIPKPNITIYNNFTGVNVSKDPMQISHNQFAFAINVWVENGLPNKRPGTVRVGKQQRINS